MPTQQINQGAPRPRISAVMNTYNAERYLEDVLRSLRGFDG